MKKHDCRIDTSNTIRGENWGYHIHPILANEEDGFIKGHHSPSEKTAVLGNLYESDKSSDRHATQWWWSLECVEYSASDRMSNKRFLDKTAAIASLSKALNRQGYRLASGDQQ